MLKNWEKGTHESCVPSSTWEFFGLARDVLGAGAFWRIFGVEKSQVSRWSVNPRAAADSQRNPIDRLVELFERMSEAGEHNAVAAMASIIAQAAGLSVTVTADDCRPDHATVEQELLDVHPVVVEHAQAILRGDSIQSIEAWERQAIKEIKQATAKAREDRMDGRNASGR